MEHDATTMARDGDSPPRDRIYLEHRDGRPAIVLPRALFRGRMWMICAFGLPFLLVPVLIDAGSGKLVASIVFQTLGLAIFGLGVFLALIRQVIVDDGEQLVVETDLFGRPVHYSNVLKRDIESVAIRAIRDKSTKAQASPRPAERASKYFAVYLDSSADREFCVGACLTFEELEWLQRTIEHWIRRGSDL